MDEENDGLLVEPIPVGSPLSSDDGLLDDFDENDGPLVDVELPISLLLSSYDGLLGVDGESDEREFPVSSDVSFVS